MLNSKALPKYSCRDKKLFGILSLGVVSFDVMPCDAMLRESIYLTTYLH